MGCQKFANALEQRGMNIRMVEPFKVSMAVVTLQVAEFMRMGLSLEGVDSFYYDKAKQDQLTLGFLESMEEQFGFMASLGKGWEDEFVDLSLRDLEKSSALYDEMNSAWRSGDVNALDQFLIAEMKRDYPDAYNQLLLIRNMNWMPQIERMFEEPGTEFVLVGVAHMVGEDGLLHQLSQLGYRVSQL